MKRVIALYDGQCALCRKTKEAFRQLDLFHRIQWSTLQEVADDVSYTNEELRTELHVLTRKKTKKGFYAVRYLLRQTPLGFPLAILLYVPFIDRIGNPVYRLIANNRHKLLASQCKDGACAIPQKQTSTKNER
ncbi:thiol-disulfide oxidoreductase DCC family protein [Bacillus fonticola]|uniref:thiol-disulfide oxidoreductase DCC family protein n=1 Tax=Bacillus fonticola TaxID=2728853 RepID=UPI001D15C71B|nr:DUF393 domain-containing protein [Bacillus fonticola]